LFARTSFRLLWRLFWNFILVVGRNDAILIREPGVTASPLDRCSLPGWKRWFVCCRFGDNTRARCRSRASGRSLGWFIVQVNILLGPCCGGQSSVGTLPFGAKLTRFIIACSALGSRRAASSFFKLEVLKNIVFGLEQWVKFVFLTIDVDKSLLRRRLG